VVEPLEVSAKSMPRPERLTVCLGVDALSVRVSVPESGPAMVGVKTICNVQAALTASVAPQGFAAIVKLDEIVALEIVSGTLPLFVSVIAWAADVRPLPVAANVTVAGLRETPAGAIAVPVMETVCERIASVKVSVAVRVPMAEGMNVTLRAQVE